MSLTFRLFQLDFLRFLGFWLLRGCSGKNEKRPKIATEATIVVDTTSTTSLNIRRCFFFRFKKVDRNRSRLELQKCHGCTSEDLIIALKNAMSKRWFDVTDEFERFRSKMDSVSLNSTITGMSHSTDVTRFK